MFTENDFKIQAATRAARARLGHRDVGVQTSQGKYQVVNVQYVARKTIVVPLSGWLDADATVAALDALVAPEVPA